MIFFSEGAATQLQQLSNKLVHSEDDDDLDNEVQTVNNNAKHGGREAFDRHHYAQAQTLTSG